MLKRSDDVMDYDDIVNLKSTEELRRRLKDMPKFMHEFFKGISDRTSFRTRTSYACDLNLFFEYFSKIRDKEIKEITLDDLDSITVEELEDYMEYITFYEKKRGEKIVIIKNDERAKSRKLAAIRTLYKYFLKKRKIKFNIPQLIEPPKIHEKAIVRLEVDEVSKLLDEVEKGDKLTHNQFVCHEKTKFRDLAIISLLLGTGIRISECVGININDINFRENGIRILRKGGNESIVYFGDEVRQALKSYAKQRKTIKPLEGHETAFFLSMHRKRITVRAVQKLVKKYTNLVTPNKKISPHKLRSTYGTNLYRETGDIYLVADVLGHKDINTTKKHYADMNEDRRRLAAKIIKLREN